MELDLKRQLPKIYKEDFWYYQIRIYCQDDDPQIKKKVLILNRGCFTTPCILSHEKHFERDSKQVVEYYSNDEMGSYFETTKKEDKHISEGFTPEGVLFSRDIHYFKKGKHFKSKIWVVGTPSFIEYYKYSIYDEEPPPSIFLLEYYLLNKNLK